MKQQFANLLFASCICLIGLIASSVLLIRDHARVRQRVLRVDGIARAYRASRSDGLSDRYRLDLEVQTATIISRIARLLHYDPARRINYPLKFPVVLLLALLLATAFTWAVDSFIGSFSWLSLPLTCFQICRWFYIQCETRVLAKLFAQFPDALAMIVRAVRVGLPIVEAIGVVARESPQPTAREFAALVAQTAIGVPLEDALRELAERNRLPEYRFFATALSLQRQTGGALAETLENLADTIRKRLAARMRGHALAAEARMSSYILGALPLVTGALLALTNPSYMAVLFTDPSGRTLLLVAIGLLSIGAFSMRMLIRKSLT